MDVTYDLSTDVGQVRLLISDTDLDAPIFDDQELAAFLTLETDVRRAAAGALETIASNEVLVLKVIDTLDLKTNGPAVSKELRDRAQALRDQADRRDSDLSDDTFAVAEYADPVFGYRDRLARQLQRGDG